VGILQGTVARSKLRILAKTGKSASNRASVQLLNRGLLLLTDEYRSKILRLLDERPEISQRKLARELGVSLGRVNFCLQALMERGLVKANNFKNSSNKTAYMYLLTRKGIAEKTQATARFLERKTAEYEALRREIEMLQREIGK
jgi:EPS-associated MarR family transcriptional regulator